MEEENSFKALQAEIKKLRQELAVNSEKLRIAQRTSEKLDVYSKLAPVAIIDLDLALNIEYWNKAAETLFGYTEKEVKGKNLLHLISNEDKDIAVGSIKDLIDNKTSGQFSVRITTKSGKQIICDWHNSSIFFESKLVGITSVILDISGQRELERKLLESNERFRILSNVSFEAIFLSDKGYGVDVNEVGIEMFGYSLDEIKKMFATDLFEETSKEIVKNNILSGYLEPYEVNGVKKNGEIFPVEVQGKNYMHNGRNIRVTAIRDISERKKAELEIKKKELQFKTIFENTGYGIAVGNNDKIVIDVNDSFCKMTGFSKEEIIGRRIEFLFDKESLDNKPLRYDLLDQSKLVVHERVIVRKDGKKVPIEMNSNKIDSDFYISFYTDLTERKKTEKALEEFNHRLKEAKEKAEESNNLKTAFLQNMLHEIRTPMNGIIGFSEMLGSPDVSVERRKFYTDIIIKSSKSLLDIVNNILDISKVETGLVEVVENKTNINKLLSELFEFFRPQAWEKHLNIFINLPLDDEGSTICVDSVKLRQVLSNLLSNALKFTHHGHIKMGYKVKDRKLIFYVKDTGIGIEGKLHDKIFERFRQADLSTTRKYGGTGLGLAISQAYVKLLKGELWLKSQKGKGSKFYFSIPIAKVNDDSPDLKENTWQSMPDMNFSSDGKVLIVEDEEFNYIYLQELMRGLEIEIIHASDGYEAVELVKANANIALVLMDLKMPGMNGLKATKKIKKLRPNLPIIAQTAYAMTEDRDRAIQAGCDNYISKPIKKAEFLRIIQNYL